MKKILIKIGRAMLWIISIILILIVTFTIIGFTLHNTYYKKQLNSIKPYGQIVDVDNKNMHVYSMGEGHETIILLPGHGVPLPSVDFAPLMRKLSEKYRVVTVEYFGVGFSDKTDKPRNCENYMNEIRNALNQAGIKPPYILMPHSISGIYSEYYATKHPEEVKGMVLLDTTSTEFVMKTPKSMIKQYEIAKLLQNIGFQRLFISCMPEEVLQKSGFGITLQNGYTQDEIDDYKKYMCYSLNDTIIAQLENTMDCVQEVKKYPFPKSVPVLKVISKQTVENNDINEYIGSMDYQKAHLNRLGDNVTYVILEGSHFIYHSQIEKISKFTDEFITNLK